MFWAVEMPSKRGVTTDPPNTCQGGVGSSTYNVTVPMPALLQN